MNSGTKHKYALQNRKHVVQKHKAPKKLGFSKKYCDRVISP